MKEEIIKNTTESLGKIGIKVDDVFLDKEGKTTYLRVVIDSDRILNIDDVVASTKIIDPIIERLDLIKEEYILDVYVKSKGGN